jgi:hypothetical protein
MKKSSEFWGLGSEVLLIEVTTRMEGRFECKMREACSLKRYSNIKNVSED